MLLLLCSSLCISGIKHSEVHLRHAVGSLQYIFSKNSPHYYISMNNRITLCCFYVQLFSTQCERSRTTVHNVNCLFFRLSKVTSYKGKASLHVIITVSITSTFPGCTDYQGIDGYFCDTLVFPIISCTRTACSPVGRMVIFASYYN